MTAAPRHDPSDVPQYVFPQYGPRITLNVEEAARSLGVSRDSFDAYILSQLAVIRIGRKQLVAVAELERWARESTEAARATGHVTPPQSAPEPAGRAKIGARIGDLGRNPGRNQPRKAA